LNDVIDIPWYIMIDFNEMLQTSDKMGGMPLNAGKVHRLDDFLAL